MGRFLTVDLATGTSSSSEAGDFGGPVAALRVLLDHLPDPPFPADHPSDPPPTPLDHLPDPPPISLDHLPDPLPTPLDDPPDLPLILVASEVAGVGGPGLARCAAVGVSPLSGAVAETRAEGPFAAGLRATGNTGVVLAGRAPRPVVVVVTPESVYLEPAGNLWGLETGPATDALATRHGAAAEHRLAVAVIGPAGERGVRYASIITCRDHPLPRLGLGAVMGAKNVKAVVCVGNVIPPVADPVTLRRIAGDFAAAVPGNKLSAWQRAEPGFGIWSGEPGYATVSNFSDTTARGGVGVAPAVERVAGCPACPVACIKVFRGVPLHQEGLAVLGPNLGVADPWPLLERCHQLGLDPVSLGGTLAAAGVPPAGVAAAIERVGAGGDPLGEGSARVAPAAAMTSKSVELPPFDPRVQPNLGLAYAVAPVGPRYDAVEHDLDFDTVEGLEYSYPEVRRLGVEVPRPRGELDVSRTAQLLRLWSGLDALGVCVYAATPTRPLSLAQVEDLTEAVTGRRPDVVALGALRLRLQREVNRRLGVSLAADTLPDRFFREPVAAGRYAGAIMDRAAFAAAVARLHEELEYLRGPDE